MKFLSQKLHFLVFLGCGYGPRLLDDLFSGFRSGMLRPLKPMCYCSKRSEGRYALREENLQNLARTVNYS